jgi:pyruvate/2-oxoglutarate dehydrogenase complex dihydrolipoamide acyltransferase (E2) component
VSAGEIRLPDDLPAPLVLARWSVADGGRVKAGERICELETERASMDLEASGDGMVWHVVRAGTSLTPGQVFGRFVADP